MTKHNANPPSASTAQASGPMVSRLAIEGMHCAACVSRLEKILSRQPGVTQATVNLTTESALIEHDSTWVPENSIAAVRKAGFDAHPLKSSLAAPESVNGPPQPAASTTEGAPAPPATTPVALPPLRVLLALAAAFFLMFPMLSGQPEWPGWLQFLISTPVQFVSGAIFLRGAWGALRTRSANMDVLVALGSLTAWGWSVALWLGWVDTGVAGQALHAPAGTPTDGSLPVHGLAPHHLFFEASTAVIAFVLLGKWMEKKTRDRTAQAIAGLAQLRPATVERLLRVDRPSTDVAANEYADLATGDTSKNDPASSDVETIAVTAVKTGDLLRVSPASRVAADGTVVRGRSHLDESALTGEPVPRTCQPGDAVKAGTLNLDGMLIMRVDKTGEHTLLGQVIDLIERAQGAKLPVQSMVDRLAAFFVPAVLFIALATLLTLLATGAEPAVALMRAVTVIVVACPCALGLATPAAIVAGTGAAARAGLLIRDPRALDAARRIDTVIFDKTGTLTEGRPALHNIVLTSSALSEPDALAIAAGLQTTGSHPLGEAIRTEADRRLLPAARFEDIRLLPGIGVEGFGLERIDRDAGNPDDRWQVSHLDHARSLLTDDDAATLQRQMTPLAAGGLTLSALVCIPASGSGARVHAVFAFSDTLRPQAASALENLRQAGLQLWLLSGDRQEAVTAIAGSLPLTGIRGRCSPADKANLITHLQQQGHRVAMVGDGVNDAPALAVADLAIAMGGGTDLAAQTAHITLMNSDLHGIAGSLDIARRIHRNIAENLFWAFAYNVVCIPLAAGGWFNPMMAAAAMALSSVSVVLNALRLSGWKNTCAKQQTVSA